MNNKNISELTLQLSQALDQNYDVVNMDAVLSVIAALEGTTITKEQLEATRLAKYINQLRRRTSSEQLARRAKSLLKKWREMVGIQQQQVNDAVQVKAAQAVCDGSQNIRFQPISAAVVAPSTAADDGTHIDLCPASVPNSNNNSSPMNTSRATNLGINTTNKRLKNATEECAGTRTAAIATEAENLKQPTSFANLIPELCARSAVRNRKEIGAADRLPHAKFSAPQNKIYNRDCLIVEPNSNSNFGSNCLPKTLSKCDSPIVIDIQDSNSGSNLISSVVPKNVELELPSCSAMSTTESWKKKKIKKDKKLKAGDIPKPAYGSQVAMLAHEHVSSNQYQQTKSSDAFGRSGMEYKQSNTTNMSEILCLSNSSVSSIFPLESASGAISSRKQLDTPSSTMSAVSSAELTFAGKFKRHNSSHALLPVSACDITDPSMHCGVSTHIMDSTTKESTKLNSQSASKKFMEFGCNSNESSSNSRVSQFEAMHAVGIANNQLYQHKNFRPDGVQIDLSIAQNTATLATENSLTPSNPVLAIEKKVPKKRGRKKGSKGVDGIISKDLSLSSQMLMTSLGSGGKKVKTTKELYAEMQNRKLGLSSAVSSPTATNWMSTQQSATRPGSSCSEPSLHSPRSMDASSSVNATMSMQVARSTPDKLVTSAPADETYSDSDSCTSEPSRDSIGNNRKREKRANSSESSSNSNCFGARTNQLKIPSEIVFDAVEQELNELLKQMPPAPTIAEIEMKCTAEIVPCTCKIIDSTLSSEEPQDTAEGNAKLSLSPTPDSKPVKQILTENSILQSSEGKPHVLEEKPLAIKPKKSIFDLDFDDDEDPLLMLLAKSTGAALKQEEVVPASEPDVLMKSEYNKVTETNSLQQEQPLQITEEPTPIVCIYHVEEDPNCEAKQRFEIQTQRITNFHINALHNGFIENVNGNWQNVDSALSGPSVKELILDIENEVNVVPKYGCFVSERIEKQLSHVPFTKGFVPKKRSSALEKYNSGPFLGASKRLVKRHSNHKQQAASVALDSQIKMEDTKSIEESNVNIDVDNETMRQQLNSADFHLETIMNEAVASNPPVCSSLHTQNNLILKDITIEVNESNNYDLSLSDSSKNLLVIANNEAVRASTAEAAQQKPSNMERTDCSRRNSICSNSSLKDVQQSINLKLRRCRAAEQEQKSLKLEMRKRKRKKSSRNLPTKSKEPKKHHIIKRLKIAINGDVATHRQISIRSSYSTDDDNERQLESDSHNYDDDDESSSTSSRRSSNSFEYNIVNDEINSSVGDDASSEDNESTEQEKSFDVDDEAVQMFEDEDDNYTGDYHEVVTRDISSTGNNHIVLTIKKTPSKTNSPSNSLSASSPVIDALPANSSSSANTLQQPRENIKIKYNVSHLQTEATAMEDVNNVSPTFKSDLIEKNEDDVSSRLSFARTSLLKRKQKRRSKQKQHVNSSMDGRKLHKELFLPHELENTKCAVYQIESCSSSCEEESSEYEYESEPFSADKGGRDKETCQEHKNLVDSTIKPCTPEILCAGSIQTEDINSDSNDTFDDDELNSTTSENEKIPTEYLPDENNGLLLSFNNIDVLRAVKEETNSAGGVQYEQLNQQIQKENCDDYNYNIKENKLSKCSNESNPTLHGADNCRYSGSPEESSANNQSVLYSHPPRLIEETNNDTSGKEFKEWHEVLQLQSYNNELLTVLPYVLLE